MAGQKEVIRIRMEAYDHAILDQSAHAERRYPWASSQPRFSLQTAIEAALAGTLTPEAALAQAQKETDDWLKQQAPK